MDHVDQLVGCILSPSTLFQGRVGRIQILDGEMVQVHQIDFRTNISSTDRFPKRFEMIEDIGGTSLKDIRRSSFRLRCFLFGGTGACIDIEPRKYLHHSPPTRTGSWESRNSTQQRRCWKDTRTVSVQMTRQQWVDGVEPLVTVIVWVVHGCSSLDFRRY